MAELSDGVGVLCICFLSVIQTLTRNFLLDLIAKVRVLLSRMLDIPVPSAGAHIVLRRLDSMAMATLFGIHVHDLLRASCEELILRPGQSKVLP